MKKWITGAAMVALALGYSQRADASIYVNINDGDGHSFTCDNGLAFTSTNCNAGIFSTLANSNAVGFIGAMGDYTFGGFSGVSANVPGTPTSGTATDSKAAITHTTGTTDLTVIFAAYGFTAPTGPNLIFSSSATANWNTSLSTDTASYIGWANPLNTTATGVGTAADSGTCTSTGVPTYACQGQSGNFAFSNPGTYSLTGLETIHLASGSQGTFTATELVSNVPEPVTFSLMGVGLLGLGFLRKRIGRS